MRKKEDLPHFFFIYMVLFSKTQMYTLARIRQLRLAFNRRYNMSDNIVVDSAIYLQVYARMAYA